MILINGKSQSQLAVTDRAIQYGDGCFTTMLVEQGQICLWPYHLERLQLTVRAFMIEDPDWEMLTHTVTQMAQTMTGKVGIKILISRGSGGRGYSTIGCDDTQIVISDFCWPTHYSQWQQQGIPLGICQQRLGLSPMLAGYKHLNRLEQVLLKREVEQQGWLDAVVMDSSDCVVETVASNLFWRKDNRLFTPKLDLSGVHGVMRRHIIELAPSIGYHLSLVNEPLESVLAADEVFITNALMALVPVNEINGTMFTEHTAISELNKRLYTC
ncbi:aminodeoxychorismate lyase [Photobacterium nomapromontoriensis]|uniref:aminodeoxychorismate lyase n=1 Tax=Photobacterium nomapromontoriensis TaxID=2910237 RepID=UPI003D0BAE02